jgi:hypothetical protein
MAGRPSLDLEDFKLDIEGVPLQAAVLLILSYS